jgi:ankyrin repeat domain-containing protein 50
MGDPLSVAGTAVGIVSLGLQVCQSLVSYYQSVKDQSKDISTTLQSLERLTKTLENFEATVNRRRFTKQQSSLVTDIEQHIYACEDAIEELDQELGKFITPGSGVRHMIKSTTRKATYPFKQGTLMKLRENVQDVLDNLALATNALLLDTNSEVLEQVHEASTVLSLLKQDLVSNNIRQWLNAPDTYGQHYDACAKRHKDTGLWFVRGLQFKSWLRTRGAFLWLNGFAGSGKTILASTIIQEVLAHRHSCTTIGIAYFYLSYADTSKQSTIGLMKSLLLQLFCQSSSNALSDLYTNYSSGGPPEYALSLTLKIIISSYTDVYIIIDALDESPKGEHRDAVCKAINEMRKWSSIHLLATSRDEPDIREALKVPSHQDVTIQNDDVMADITTFIKEALKEDTKLTKWKAFYSEIESALTQGAGGM